MRHTWSTCRLTIARPPWTGCRRFPNLIVCRTFSKMYGLAGMRVGYAISHPELAELLNRVRQPFNVNGLAQVAALAALDAHDHVLRSQEANRRGLAQLRTGMTKFGWSVPPSAGNFVLADTGGSAASWYEGLLRAGIIVRPMASYGLAPASAGHGGSARAERPAPAGFGPAPAARRWRVMEHVSQRFRCSPRLAWRASFRFQATSRCHIGR